jgi:repressor LexA
MNKALAIWQQIDAAYEDHAPMPTVRELCEALGLSSTSVALYYLMRLEREGIIGREPGKARNIRLLRRFGE